MFRPAPPRLGRLAGGVLAALVSLGTPAAGLAAPPESGSPESDLVAPVLLEPATLEYPVDLLELEEPPAGTVVVKYVVGVDGVPKELEVTQSVHPVLDAAAKQAVQRLRYEPATYRGTPVEVVLSIGLEIAPPLPLEDPEDPDEPSLEDPDAPDPEGTEEPDASEPPVRIQGKLLEAGDRVGVGAATVLAVPAADLEVGEVRKKRYGEEPEPEWSFKTVTDVEGSFELRGVPDGRVRLIFLAQGFDRVDWVIELEAGEVSEGKYYARRVVQNPFRTEVAVERAREPEVTSRPISREELASIPGTQGDALKAIQNFPGVARGAFGIGQVAIRGAAPADSALYLGYHEIPTLFHFGGLTSVFNSDILTEIDFIPGNFDSRYGDAIGGVVNVVPRKGRRDGYHGYLDIDLFDSGLLVEGPVGKGSFILSARRSYIDAILPVVIPDDVNLGLSLAPRYWDYQALFDYPVGAGDLSVRVFGSDDRTELLFAEENDVEPDEEDTFESIQYFHRADIIYKVKKGPWEFLVTPSYRREFIRIGAGGIFRLDVDTDNVTGRAEIARRLSKRARFRVGTEYVSTHYVVSVEGDPIGGGDGTGGGETLTREVEAWIHNPAVYTTLTLAPTDKLSLYPGVRIAMYSMPTDQLAVDPRIRFAWQFLEKTSLKGGVGIYSQDAEIQETDAVFGNPRLGIERASHLSLGVLQELLWDSSVEVTGFWRELYNLASVSEMVAANEEGQFVPEFYASTGRGRSYGMELLLRRNLSKNLFGWVSYTLSRSVLRDDEGQPQYLSDFDQTHILTILASYKLPYDWQVGGRFRLVSGSPTTPIRGGVVDESTGDFIPLQGPRNGERLPTFHQLDFRVDKTWVKRLVKVTAYLDIQNVYNARNVEFWNYSYDFSQRAPIAGLPTAPSFGTKIEW